MTEARREDVREEHAGRDEDVGILDHLSNSVGRCGADVGAGEGSV